MPPFSSAPGASNQINPNFVIDLKLSVDQVNRLLFLLATHPLKEVLDIYSTIRAQGDMAVASAVASGTSSGSGSGAEPPEGSA